MNIREPACLEFPKLFSFPVLEVVARPVKKTAFEKIAYKRNQITLLNSK